MSRPQVSRPSGGNRPNVSNRPNMGSRPGGGINNRPNIGAGNRPNIGTGNRPNIGTGNRPNIDTGNRPNIGTGNRPNIGAGGGGIANRPTTRPSLPNRGGGIGAGIGAGIGVGIGAGIGNRPGAGDRPGSGIGNNRPGSGVGDRPGQGTLPGLDNRPGDRFNNRGGSISDRHNNINDRMKDRNGNRNDRQDNRQDNRGDRQDNRGDRQDNRTDKRDDRQDNRQDNRSDRQDNRQGNREDRQDNRQDNRGDRQDNRQDAINDWRNNWQDSMNDYWGHHDDWHHGWCGWNTCGNWCGNWWNQYPIWGAFGITSWALNSASYLYGLGSYSNPYYVESAVVGGYDYSQPIVIEQSYVQTSQQPAVNQAASTDALPPGVTTQGMSLFNEARTLFHNKQYQEALSKDNEALKQMPKDAALHEFKALCHFALGDYKSAAATLYAVLSVGPGWDWTTMYNLYEGIDEYTAQLRKLEDYCREHKDSADAYFVLAYHYLTMDKKDLAIKMYQTVAKLTPNDAVTKQMLELLGSKPIDDKTPPPPANAADTAPTIPVEKLVGEWKALGPNNVDFKLKLTKEGEYNWSYTKNGKTESVKGAYGQDGGYLVMESNSNNKLIADVKLVNDSTMEFQMTGMSSTPKLLFKK